MDEKTLQLLLYYLPGFIVTSFYVFKYQESFIKGSKRYIFVFFWMTLFYFLFKGMGILQ